MNNEEKLEIVLNMFKECKEICSNLPGYIYTEEYKTAFLGNINLKLGRYDNEEDLKHLVTSTLYHETGDRKPYFEFDRSGKGMVKKYDGQAMKFEITKDKIKMEISIDDLVELLKNSPENFDNAEVKKDKKQEFAEYIVETLRDDAPLNEDCVLWGIPFEAVFNQIFEGDEDFCDYPDNEDWEDDYYDEEDDDYYDEEDDDYYDDDDDDYYDDDDDYDDEDDY